LCFVFAQNRMPFQAKGTPLAINLIAIDHSFLETVHLIFSTLNTSNQDHNIQEIPFVSVRFHLCR
ncbi:MAG: hypothetical protein KAQ71_04275, partial [Desulfobulbaceae bacterium]|nr:hypothetical protein [Desulfobulbaceae bacterium]